MNTLLRMEYGDINSRKEYTVTTINHGADRNTTEPNTMADFYRLRIILYLNKIGKNKREIFND